jgi:hypothetical protein
MSTDIHLHAEVLDQTGRWQALSVDAAGLSVQIAYDQPYSFFAALAGVRRYQNEPRIAPVRGLPDDVSGAVYAAAVADDGFGHHFTHLSVPEIAAFDWRWSLAPEFSHEAIPDRVARLTSEIPVAAGVDPDRVRYVFWFDS